MNIKTIFAIYAFVLLLLAVAPGQDKPAPKASPMAIEAPKTEKDTIILTREKVLSIENFNKSVRIAELEIQAAIPAKLRESFDKAAKDRDDYWASEIGIKPADLNLYDISQGVNGDLILKKKPTPSKPTPAAK